MASVFMGPGDDAVPILAVRSSMPGGVGEMLMMPVTSMAYRISGVVGGVIYAVGSWGEGGGIQAWVAVDACLRSSLEHRRSKCVVDVPAAHDS